MARGGPLSAPDASTPGSGAGLRVISLNAWCGGLLDALMAWLPQCGADVLCIQEATSVPGYDGWVEYRDADRTSWQRASLFADLRRALPEHQAVFHTCDTGPVRCEDGETRTQKFGIATLIAPHLSVVDSEASYVHGGFARHDAWPAEDRGRIAHACRVVGPAGRGATIAHFHGVRMGAGKSDTPERRTQAERVVELVTRVRAPEDVVVVAGDMNVLPDSVTFEVFGEAGLTDLVGTADTRTSAYPKPVRHADYLLVSDPGAVTSFDVLAEPEVSDHRPLMLDLDLG